MSDFDPGTVGTCSPAFHFTSGLVLFLDLPEHTNEKKKSEVLNFWVKLRHSLNKSVKAGPC